MKIYIAAKYQDRLAAYDLANFLRMFDDLEVVSRWCNNIGVSPHGFKPTDETIRISAEHDLEDIAKCDMFILLQRLQETYIANGPHDADESGGRHVELGYALALKKEVLTVGKRNNVFHWLPAVTQMFGPELGPKHILHDIDGNCLLSHDVKVAILNYIKPKMEPKQW